MVFKTYIYHMNTKQYYQHLPQVSYTELNKKTIESRIFIDIS